MKDWCQFFAAIEEHPEREVHLTVREHLQARDHVQNCDNCFNRTERVLLEIMCRTAIIALTELRES